MGLKLNIYNGIKTALESIVTGSERDIKTVGKWNNQFSQELNENPATYPRVYIGYSQLLYQNKNPVGSRLSVGKTGIEQTCNFIITLYCGFERYEDTSDSWLIIEPILLKIHYAINTLDITNCAPILRTEEREDNDHDNVIVWEIDFIGEGVEAGQDKTVSEGDQLIAGGVLETDTLTNRGIDIDNQIIRTGDGTI